MPLLGAFIVPHPPLIVPEVGRGEEKKISATENAYKETASIPRSMAQSMIGSIISAPCLCPSLLERFLCLAHRPLPSMIIATWRGTASVFFVSLLNIIRSRLNKFTPRGYSGAFFIRDLRFPSLCCQLSSGSHQHICL